MSWEVDGKSEKHVQGDHRGDARRRTGCSSPPTPTARARRFSWHVHEMLKARRGMLKGGRGQARRLQRGDPQRRARGAFRKPRDIDIELVDAYLARRALDYLVGFTLSPVLWRKLPGSRSAGRVQSVALRA